MKLTNQSPRIRLYAIFLSLLLLTALLTGCKRDGSPETQTNPATEPLPPETTLPHQETQPPEPVIGTVSAAEIKIRTGVGDFHELAGTLKNGEVVEILEQRDVNGVRWGRIAEGWICLTYVQIEGETNPDSDETSSATMIGTVIAQELNVRSGPGTKYEVTKRLKRGDAVTVTEMSGTWGKTEEGWLNTVFIYFPDSLDSVTVKATVTADKLNVRAGPGTSYESLRKLQNGDEIEIIKQVTIREVLWGYIGDGWVSMEYVDIIQ